MSTISTQPSPTTLTPKHLAKDNTEKETKSTQNKDKKEKDANQIKKAESSEVRVITFNKYCV